MARVLVFVLLAAAAFGADWNPRLAADYLDSRQKEWFAWKPAEAPGGPCVSCHTGVTYLLARPALRRALGESRPTSYETGLLSGLRARVAKHEGKEVFPSFTKEPLTSQALGVESIHAALFLARETAGTGKLSPEARQAFDRMWSFQIREEKAKGAWSWFDFNLDPWETADSGFYGAALAALAAGSAPLSYRDRPEIGERIAALTGYLRREQAMQPLHNRLVLLWASTKLPESLPESMRRPIIEEAWQKQQSDGGWTMEGLGPWKEHATAPGSTGSNSYATGLAAFALETSGIAHSDPRLIKALDWLRSHQDSQFGYWTADSMNKRHEPGSMPVQFMRDAATGFAVLALTEAER